MRPNFKRARWEDLKTDLRGFENEPENHPSEMYNDFVAMVNDAKNRHIPKCRPKTIRHQLPWMRGPRIEKITDVMFTIEEVEERLQELNPNKAAGPDGVAIRLMKECAKEMAQILHQIQEVNG